MKQLLLFILLIPALAHCQEFELGLNYGSEFNATASVRFYHHIKAGLGYKYENQVGKGIFGDAIDTTRIKIPYVFIEYYKRKRKHEFYGGLDIARIYLISSPDLIWADHENGIGIGLHAGYNLKLYRGFFGNVQIGGMNFKASGSSSVNNMGTQSTSTGNFMSLTLGIHYIFKVRSK
jgi:hypothetical protein